MGDLTDTEIENRMGYHRATFPQGYDPETDLLADLAGYLTAEGVRATAPDHATLRRAYIELAKKMRDITAVPSREQSLALTALQESLMWANAAVAMRSPLIEE